MAEAEVIPKDPRFVESGRRGARLRWGGRRLVRLSELHPHVRAAVVALVEADEATKQKAAAVNDGAPATAEEGTRDALTA